MPARPTSPVPSNPRVLGSGVTMVSPLIVPFLEILTPICVVPATPVTTALINVKPFATETVPLLKVP